MCKPLLISSMAAAALVLLTTMPVAFGHEQETDTIEEKTVKSEAPAYRYSRYPGYRHHNRYHDRMREQRRAWADAKRNELDRYHSARRWWNNPAAEDRRIWNRSRSVYNRDMADARSEAMREQMERQREYMYSRRPYSGGYGPYGGGYGPHDGGYGPYDRGGYPW